MSQRKTYQYIHLKQVSQRSTDWIWFHEGVPFSCCCCLCLILSAKSLTFTNLTDKTFVMLRENSGKWDETNRTSREKRLVSVCCKTAFLRKEKNMKDVNQCSDSTEAGTVSITFNYSIIEWVKEWLMLLCPHIWCSLESPSVIWFSVPSWLWTSFSLIMAH